MPRSTISLEPYDPPTPMADGMSNGLAAVLHGIQERQRRDVMKEEQNYQRQRNARMDSISERRMSLEEKRAQRLLDSETATGSKTTKPVIALKDARSLAIEQAKLQAPKDEYGNVQSIDPDLVEELTDYIMKYGTVPSRRSKVPEGTDGTPKVENTGEIVESEPGIMGKWWDRTKDGAQAVMDMLGGDGEPMAEVTDPASTQPGPGKKAVMNMSASAPGGLVTYEDDGGSITGASVDKEPAQGERLGDRWSAINTISNYLGLGGGEKAPASAPAIDPNTPEPDQKYLDTLEQIGNTDQEKLVKILRELKARSPSEYAAVERKFRERRASKQPVK